MCSSEDEKVKFSEIVDPAAAKGAVEKWLLQVEKVMQSSVYSQIKEAMQAYTVTPRSNWVLSWPGQVVICVGQIFWTKEVTEVIKAGKKDGLVKYRDFCTRQMEEIVALVRGKLSPMARLTLSALVVIDVHARDTIADLAKVDLKGEEDFEWTSQLRYYWENDNVYVRMINATLKYGYEYLGNCPRLVITSLTDRCYRTLIGALDLNLGGGNSSCSSCLNVLTFYKHLKVLPEPVKPKLSRIWPRQLPNNVSFLTVLMVSITLRWVNSSRV
jgi:dynein heavy chain